MKSIKYSANYAPAYFILTSFFSQPDPIDRGH